LLGGSSGPLANGKREDASRFIHIWQSTRWLPIELQLRASGSP
jgi:hypothetical protein